MSSAHVEFDPQRQISVLDVLLGFDDGLVDATAVAALSTPRMIELLERLTDFYSSWRPPLPGREEMRMSLAETEMLAPALLYADSVAVPDPVFEWLVESIGALLYEARNFRGGMISFEDHHRDGLARAIESLGEWQPLIERGWLVPTPVQAERFYEFRALLRSPERNPALFVAWEALFERASEGEQLSPAETVILNAGLARQDALEEAETDDGLVRSLIAVTGRDDPMNLAVALEGYVSAFGQAASVKARPLATQPGEWAYLLHRLRVASGILSANERVTMSVIPALASSELPFITDVPVQALLAIREEEQAFREWQLDLSRAVRAVEALPIDDSFEEEARAVLDEALIPAAESVRKSTSRTRAIARTSKDSGLRLGLGAAAGAGAVPLGLPVSYALGSAGMSALVDLTVKAIRSEAPEGSHAVLAHLLRH